MEIPVTFADRPSIKDSLNVEQKLGEGKFQVYQVRSSRRRATYSLKVFPKTEHGARQYKKEKVVAKLRHQNVIEYVPVQCHSNKFYGLTTELAEHGDFFELVTRGILSTELLVRTYFHQLIAGIEHIHSQGIAHLDLKLENLMLGSKYTLKIIDFDQAQPTRDTYMSSGGTTGYRAPEVLKGTCKNFAAADIYSAGIILFAFLAREFPFYESEVHDPLDRKSYAYFVADNETYWKEKTKRKNDSYFFSQDFKTLLNGMLRADPASRFKLRDIKNSEWFKGPVVLNEVLQTVMQINMQICSKDKKAN